MLKQWCEDCLRECYVVTQGCSFKRVDEWQHSYKLRNPQTRNPQGKYTTEEEADQEDDREGE